MLNNQQQRHYSFRLLSNSCNITNISNRNHIWKIYFFILLQLAIASIKIAVVNADISATASVATATATVTSATKENAVKMSVTTFINNNNSNNIESNSSGSSHHYQHPQHHHHHHRNGEHDEFFTLDKEVVDRLIKQWAPVVWLAPEEIFMPLGVDEFLNHVHPMDKEKKFIPGMPVGDNSEKAYLVTNAEIEELLKNENSFIYGRNPNESPVPIYAVVTLCNEQQQSSLSGAATSSAANNFKQINTGVGEGKLQQQQQQHHITMISTRGSYIPVSFNPLEERNDTIRRSSRLYPVFQRVRRDVDQSIETAAYEPPQAVLLQNTRIPPPSPPPGTQAAVTEPLSPDYGLVMGETSTGEMDNRANFDIVVATPEPTNLPENNSGQYNNFIANLADNVKFSTGSDEFDNNINFESNFNEPAMTQTEINNGRRKVPAFHVTYWMFYPYSQGKTMCTISLGPLGNIPFPALYGFCLGRRKDIGSHIGDWEHMTLYFNGDAEPEAMYVSAHDAGAYYSYNHLTGSFEFKKQETRKGILQRPNFPKTVTTFNNHPVLFAAKGSHGLWTAPGKHRFVKVARLYDINGFGTPWNTWKAVDITYENLKSYGRSLIPPWLSFKGKWGNPKSKCHPFRRIGLNFCEYTDGPTGIPLKEPHFQCGATTFG